MARPKEDKHVHWKDEAIKYIEKILPSEIGVSSIKVDSISEYFSQSQSLCVKIVIDDSFGYFSCGDSVKSLVEHIKICVKNKRLVPITN